MLIELNNDAVIEALFNVGWLKICFIREYSTAKEIIKMISFSLNLVTN